MHICKRCQPHFGDHGVGTFPGLRTPHAARCQQREHDVLTHRFPWRQLVKFLKNHHAVRPRPLHGLAIQQDAPLAGGHETAHRLEQGTFAAARGTQQHKPVCGMHIQGHLVGGPHHPLRSGVGQADALHLQQGRRRCIHSGLRRHGVLGRLGLRCSGTAALLHRRPVPVGPCTGRERGSAPLGR